MTQSEKALRNPYSAREAMQLACRLTKKWGLYLSMPEPDWWQELTVDEFFSQLKQAAPYLFTDPRMMDSLASGYVGEQFFLLFDTQDEMENHFWLTVGDDGPTKSNPYKGKVRVYALTCNNHGQLQNENT